MKQTQAGRHDETRDIPQHKTIPQPTGTDNVTSSHSATNTESTLNTTAFPLPWRDAREAMHNDPYLRLHIPFHLPGPGEILQGKSAPSCGEVDMLNALPNIALKHGNLRWLVLIIEIYLRFLEKKAPPFHIRLDTINELHKILRDLQPHRTCDETNEGEIMDIPFSMTEAFALREAVLCCRWAVRDWLPDCEERRNLLVPLEHLRREINRVLNETN